MSETDETAIEIVRNLQTNLRKLGVAVLSIFAIAILTAVFWGGGINNQVETNTGTGKTNAENIKELSDLLKDFVTDQKVKNENFATEDDVKSINYYWEVTSDNLAEISFWAKAKGFEGFTRSIDINDIKK